MADGRVPVGLMLISARRESLDLRPSAAWASASLQSQQRDELRCMSRRAQRCPPTCDGCIVQRFSGLWSGPVLHAQHEGWPDNTRWRKQHASTRHL